jgi:hypothetical protein
MRGMQCNVEFRNQNSICSRNEKYHKMRLLTIEAAGAYNYHPALMG